MKRPALVLIAVLTLLRASSAQPYAFTRVQHPESRDTIVNGMNNDGLTVGQHGTINFSRPFNPNVHGFLFDGQEFRDIVYPGAVATAPEGINDAGIVVGSYVNSAGRTAAFRFDGTNYETLDPLPGVESSAIDINRFGQIVGAISADQFTDDIRGFRFSDGVFEEFGYPGASATFVGGNNDQNHIVGTFFQAGVAAAFVNTDFAPITPEQPGTPDGRGVNDRGEVVGNHRVITELVNFTTVRVATLGFLYDSSSESFQTLPFPTSDCTVLLDVSAPEVSDECIRAIRDINDLGQFAGYADDANGRLFGFVGTPENRVVGDFDGAGTLDLNDIALISEAATTGSLDDSFDLDRNDVIDVGDIGIWIRDLKQTWFGDANLDGEFNSADVVQVFARGQYEDDVTGNSSWASGDWSGDGEFQSDDIVIAFRDGGFEIGPRTAQAVPETETLLPLLLLPILVQRRRATKIRFR